MKVRDEILQSVVETVLSVILTFSFGLVLASCAGKKAKNDAEMVEIVMRKHSKSLQKCYRASLSAKKYRSGEYDFHFEFNSNGVMTDVKINRSDLKDPALETCLYEEIRGYDFPPPLSGGKFELNYTVRFVSAKD